MNHFNVVTKIYEFWRQSSSMLLRDVNICKISAFIWFIFMCLFRITKLINYYFNSASLHQLYSRSNLPKSCCLLCGITAQKSSTKRISYNNKYRVEEWVKMFPEFFLICKRVVFKTLTVFHSNHNYVSACVTFHAQRFHSFNYDLILCNFNYIELDITEFFWKLFDSRSNL